MKPDSWNVEHFVRLRPDRRRGRRHCTCGQPATHQTMQPAWNDQGACALMDGCELCCRRFARQLRGVAS